MESESTQTPIKLNYKITDPAERTKLVYQIIQNTPAHKLTPFYLEKLGKYLTQTPAAIKEKSILTDNMMVTVNKRELSYEGFVEKLENGEDGIYNYMTGGDKNILFTQKKEITEKDIAEVPGLKQLVTQIEKVEERKKKATGRTKFLLMKQIIQMRKDQYVLKNAYNQLMTITNHLTKSINKIDLTEHITINQCGQPVSDGLISFFNPAHIICLLCNYIPLKRYVWGKFDNDLYYLMEDFDKLIDKALKIDYPILYDILSYKIKDMSNKDIAAAIKKDYNISYSPEYLSSLWRKKIPKLIAEKAKEDWIVWHYTFEEYGKWKRCSRCHEIKLAHPYFFTKNKTSKDGYYSLCKCCRNKKAAVGKKD